MRPRRLPGGARRESAGHFTPLCASYGDSGEGSADGFQAGVGIERRFGSNLSLGLEYLATRLDDGNYRVRAQGPAPATNPFIRVNPAGTDFRRSDEDFDLDSLRLTATWRFGGRLVQSCASKTWTSGSRWAAQRRSWRGCSRGYRMRRFVSISSMRASVIRR